MESRMPNLRKRAGTPRFLVLVLTVVTSLTLAGAASAEFPTKRSDPSVSGTPQEGQTLSGSTGQWLDANGLPCPDCKYRYTWQRCNADTSGCADVPGATGFSYTLGAADVGRRIRIVEWIFKRDCGELNYSTNPPTQECQDVEKNGTSALTATVAPKPVTVAQASAPPTVQGLAMEEETLQATGGTWTGPGTITKAFFWQRCNAVGEGCATILGAAGPRYKLTNADVGSRIRVIETASNEGGTSQAVSNTTSVVGELRPTAARPTIAASRVELPHRLLVDRIVVRQSGSRVTVQIRVSDDRGFRVTGVLVRAQPTGLLAGSAAARATTRTGWATFSYRATGSGTTYVYAEASKRGEKAQTGVSSANIFRIRVG
jgi:hypothetical protein